MTWVTDADGLIRRSSLTDSDRDFLLLMARSGGLSLPLFVMLYYLRTEMVASIPDEVLERLAAQARRAPVLYRDAVLAGAHQPTIAAMQAPKRLETKTGL